MVSDLGIRVVAVASLMGVGTPNVPQNGGVLLW